MKPDENAEEILDRALQRLGKPPARALESARERVWQRLRTADPPTKEYLASLPDAKPASLWGLRQPFLVLGAVALGILVVSGLTIRSRFAEPPPPEVAIRIEAPRPAPASAIQPAQPSRIDEASVTPKSRPSVQYVPQQPPEPSLETELIPPQPVEPRPQQQLVALPDGAAKDVLIRACSGCHTPGAVGSQHFSTRVEYTTLVRRMIDMGAVLSPDESSILVNYLFDQLGTSPAQVAGRAILDRACTGCHTLRGIENQVLDDEDAYRNLLMRMVSYGADVNEADLTMLTGYLFMTYGKKTN